MPDPTRPVVAIDGPAGAGKSTIARRVARQGGFTYVDTGATYRAVGVLARERGTALDDEVALAALVGDLSLGFVWVGEEQRVLVGERDISEAIRTPAASRDASTVSRVGAVRGALVALQRRMAGDGRIVMEGRDIGTVVFPDARLKVFLTASPRVRGERRYRQLLAAGKQADLAQVVAEIEARDKQDRTRPISPLVQAADAVVIDTDALDVEGVVCAIEDLVRGRFSG